MQNLGADRIKDEAILVARILLIMLFVVFGWSKLTNYSGTVGSMTQLNLPMPSVTALVVIAVEVFVALAIAFGAWTRPLVVLLALYTLGTTLIGHHFWTMEGAARNGNAINFYKNISIIGGLILLYVYRCRQVLSRRAARLGPLMITLIVDSSMFGTAGRWRRTPQLIMQESRSASY
jgi:putative oxidoreductase